MSQGAPKRVALPVQLTILNCFSFITGRTKDTREGLYLLPDNSRRGVGVDNVLMFLPAISMFDIA